MPGIEPGPPGACNDSQRPGSYRKRSVNTSRTCKAIEKRFQRNPRVSIRQIARDMGISDRLVKRIAKAELGLKPYNGCTKHFGDSSTSPISKVGLGLGWNYRKWQNSFEFVEEGVKINQKVFRRDILEAVVVPLAQKHLGNVNWTFQQVSALAHKAKKAQERCKVSFPAMISSEEWPSYTPDLNTMDYSVWSILESRACTKPHKTLDSLKQLLLWKWDRLKINMT
ncbi:uncharacterized protein TNCV_469241 [Trichonephila clavipes]|nr:uncharacterized protein TNCV_469241 [Trichonephila clavipes]